MSPKSAKLNSSAASYSLPTLPKIATAIIALLAINLALLAPVRTTLRALPSRFPSTVRKMTTSATESNLTITPRLWSDRGHADYGWLHTFHTFSFSSYYDPKHESFGPLRVINEDRVAPGTGFGAHSHAEFLIWSYVLSGELEHKDSMGNIEYLRRGEVQFTSAGTGIRHSEYNRNTKEETHFLQIWAKPNARRLQPNYVTRKFTDEEKKDKLVRIIESLDREGKFDVTTADKPIPLHADVSMSASILSPGKNVVHDIVADGERKIYVHVPMSGRTQAEKGGRQIKIGGTTLKEGDGAYIEGAKGPGKIEIESIGEEPAEFLLFDMGQDA